MCITAYLLARAPKFDARDVEGLGQEIVKILDRLNRYSEALTDLGNDVAALKKAQSEAQLTQALTGKRR
jgi:hypothetical protein